MSWRGTFQKFVTRVGQLNAKIDVLTKVRPAIRGNAWNVIQDADDALLYLSDQWDGRIFGYEERAGVSLAQSDEVVVGVLAVGSGTAVAESNESVLYPWHLIDEAGAPTAQAMLGAEAGAQAMLAMIDSARVSLPTVLALSEPAASTTQEDVAAGSPLRTRLVDRLKASVDALKPWNKRVFVDRVHLQLLQGAPQMSQIGADHHYATVAQSLRQDIAAATGQGGLPLILVCQDAGTRTQGDFETILAEGRLDIEHPSMGIVVVTPLYRFALETGSLGTIHPGPAIDVADLHAYAVAAIYEDDSWFCPSLEAASINGTQITARFLAKTKLVLEEGFHGFTLQGAGAGVDVKSVTVEGKFAHIELNKAPKADFKLCYAWGQTIVRHKNLPVNQGAVRDLWTAVGRRGRPLYRWALAGRVDVSVEGN